MRVMVTGSRVWTNEETIREALIEVAGETLVADMTLIHGAAMGADRLAGKVARELGWAVEEFPANWSDLGKRAGYVRNQEMVDSRPDIVLAFPIGDSRGTRMAMSIAEVAGIRVINYGDDHWS